MLCACLQPARAPKVEILLRTSGGALHQKWISRVLEDCDAVIEACVRRVAKRTAGPEASSWSGRCAEENARPRDPCPRFDARRRHFGSPTGLFALPRQASDMSTIFKEEKSKLISILWLVVDAVRAKRSPVEANSLLSGKRTGNLAKMCASSQIVVSNSNSQSID